MNGIHDLGGMDGFGPIEREQNEPVFHAQWERRVFAIALATMRSRYYNTDELRRCIERMPPARYLGASYYERWLHAIETLLLEKNLLSGDELNTRIERLFHAEESNSAGEVLAPETSSPTTIRASVTGANQLQGHASPRHEVESPALFKPGDHVVARNANPSGHTRLPRYVRGRRGIVRHDWGIFVFPDTHAHGLGANPQHCYAVEFSAQELWGDDHSSTERIYVDLWENYLSPGQAVQRKPPRREPAHAVPHQAIPKSRGTLR